MQFETDIWATNCKFKEIKKKPTANNNVQPRAINDFFNDRVSVTIILIPL